MSNKLPEDLAFKEDRDSQYKYCSDNLNFSTVAHDIEDHAYQKKKIMRDPMSHRIIEKRRRDRMNNCLADLSRLIPPDYLKKGRGRIEKTEIIEMAIKHMRHLQSIISSSRMTGPRDVSIPLRTVAVSDRDGGNSAPAAIHQPISTEHYRLGYLECLSEAMHFLVEVQGYFAGDSLCVQMINHLHKHCDAILKTNSLNYPREHFTETTSSNSSASPTNGNYANNSPFSRPSFSNGSNSDDNHASERFFESGRTFESNDDLPANVTDDFRLPRSCSDLPKDCEKSISDSNRPRYSEIEVERTSENPSDSDLERMDDGKNIHEDVSSYGMTGFASRDCSSSSGIGSSGDCPVNYDKPTVRDEKGSSQLRIMLTSPKTVALYNANGEGSAPSSEVGKHSPPKAQFPECDTSLKDELENGKDQSFAKVVPHLCHTDASPEQYSGRNCDISGDFHRGNPETFGNADTHSNMYKFKNNIKQRFSKERRHHENLDWNCAKKLKYGFTTENYTGPDRCESCGTGSGDPLPRERFHILEESETHPEYRHRYRHLSESDIQIQAENESSDQIEFASILRHANRSEAPTSTRTGWRKCVENKEMFQARLPSPFSKCKKTAEQRPTESEGKPEESLAATRHFPSESPAEGKFRGKERPEDNLRVPVFALHAKGLFYVPLTLDRSVLSSFSSSLGLTEPSEKSAAKPCLHPVTISVNYEISLSSSDHGMIEKPWKSPG